MIHTYNSTIFCSDNNTIIQTIIVAIYEVLREVQIESDLNVFWWYRTDIWYQHWMGAHLVLSLISLIGYHQIRCDYGGKVPKKCPTSKIILILWLNVDSRWNWFGATLCFFQCHWLSEINPLHLTLDSSLNKKNNAFTAAQYSFTGITLKTLLKTLSFYCLFTAKIISSSSVGWIKGLTGHIGPSLPTPGRNAFQYSTNETFILYWKENFFFCFCYHFLSMPFYKHTISTQRLSVSVTQALFFWMRAAVTPGDEWRLERRPENNTVLSTVILPWEKKKKIPMRVLALGSRRRTSVSCAAAETMQFCPQGSIKWIPFDTILLSPLVSSRQITFTGGKESRASDALERRK